MYVCKFDLDDDGMEPSNRSSVDGQNCTWLGKNPLPDLRVDLISFHDDHDERKTIFF